MPAEPSDPLAGALVADRAAPLTAQFERYATGLFDRFDHFGYGIGDGSSPLLDALTARWTLPDRLEGGIELFDLEGFAELSRAWSSRSGYFDAAFDANTPHIVPIDGAQPTPLDAREVRRARPAPPAGAMRPVAPPRVMRFSGSEPSAPTLVEPVAIPAHHAAEERSPIDGRRSRPAPVAADAPGPTRADAGQPRSIQAARPGSAHDRGTVGTRVQPGSGQSGSAQPRSAQPAQPGSAQPASAASVRPETARADARRSTTPQPEHAHAADPRPTEARPDAAETLAARAGATPAASPHEVTRQDAAERDPVRTASGRPAQDDRAESDWRTGTIADARPAVTAGDQGLTTEAGSPRARATSGERSEATTFQGRTALPRATLARERWRAVDGQHISPYPAAMGRAGALDAGMVRFPEARARIGGRQPGIVAGPSTLDLMADGRGLTPASRGAERLIQALIERLVPTGADPVSSWLIPLLPTIGQDPEAMPSLLDGVLVTPVADGASDRSETVARAAGRAPLPNAVTGIGRPRPDGRVAMPRISGLFDPSIAIGADPGAEPMALSGLRSPALDGHDPIYGGPLADAGALIEPVADRWSADGPSPSPVAARAHVAPVAHTADRRVGLTPTAADRSAPIGERPAPRTATGTSAPPSPRRTAIGPASVDQPLPAPTLSARTAAVPGERRAVPQDGARAWMLAALENPAGLGAATVPAFGGPGSVGAASRALAERLAVAMGEVPLLAPSPSAPTFSRLIDAAPDAAVVAPIAQRIAQRNPSGAAPAEAPRAAAPDDSSGKAPSAGRVEAVPEPGAITGQTGRAAAAWAARIGDRLAGSATVDAEPAVAGIVARIEQRLLQGAPGLVSALRRFEAADEPVAGARAWQAVVAEAGLDPQAAELITPVADGLGRVAPTSSDRRAPGEPSPVPAPVMPAVRAAVPSAIEGAASARAPFARGPSIPDTPARRPIGARPMPAAERALHPLAASGPSVFEQRMGRLPGARAAGPAEQSRWVLDPAGRRWLVPLTAGAPAPAPAARQAPSPATPVAGETPRGSYVARRQAAVHALAERIGAAMNPPAAESGSMARVLSRLSPAHQHAWITSGFDLDRLPPADRAAIGAMIAPAAGLPEIGRSSTTAPVAAAAAPVELPIASAARMMARTLSRPGALGSALSGLAERIESRPDRALRRDGTPGRPLGSASIDGASDRVMTSAEAAAEPGALVSAEAAAAPRRAKRQPVASSMDPAALLASGASATESRMPARLARLWAAATGVEPAPSAAPAFEARTPRVVVEPGGGESSGDVSSTASDFGEGGASSSSVGARASLPGGRTAEAALRAFDRARAGDRTRASALGRAAVSGDIGQLLTTLGAESPGGQLFGDRGPVAITPPTAGRVFIETGSQAAGNQPLRSAGESPGRQVETNEQARHRNAEQIEGDMSPEELERLAEQVIERLRQEAEFDSARFGADEWD